MSDEATEAKAAQLACTTLAAARTEESLTVICTALLKLAGAFAASQARDRIVAHSIVPHLLARFVATQKSACAASAGAGADGDEREVALLQLSQAAKLLGRIAAVSDEGLESALPSLLLQFEPSAYRSAWAQVAAGERMGSGKESLLAALSAIQQMVPARAAIHSLAVLMYLCIRGF